MAAARRVQMGYNHNIRYAGRVFHVQTEDAGDTQGHVETHVFHEGAIVASQRVAHVEIAGDPAAYRQRMQEQHRAMLQDLCRGAYDERVHQILGLALEGAVARSTAALSAAAAAAGLGGPQVVMSRPVYLSAVNPAVRGSRPTAPLGLQRGRGGARKTIDEIMFELLMRELAAAS